MKNKLITFLDGAVRSLDEKLRPYASAHSVAMMILGENHENVVFVQDEEQVAAPEIALFVSADIDREKFFRGLEKTVAWHNYRMEWMKTAGSLFVVGNSNVEYKVRVYDQREKRSVVKNLPFALEVL